MKLQTTLAPDSSPHTPNKNNPKVASKLNRISKGIFILNLSDTAPNIGDAKNATIIAMAITFPRVASLPPILLVIHKGNNNPTIPV